MYANAWTYAMCLIKYFRVVNSLSQILQAGRECSDDRWVFKLKNNQRVILQVLKNSTLVGLLRRQTVCTL